MSMVLGTLFMTYSTFRLEQTGYYLSDIRLNVVVTHPYLEIGLLLLIFGTIAAIIGMVMKE